jgi:hypothetical protein
MVKRDPNFSFRKGYLLALVLTIFISCIGLIINSGVRKQKRLVEDKAHHDAQVLTDLNTRITEILTATTVTPEYLELAKKTISEGKEFPELADSLSVVEGEYSVNSKAYIDDKFGGWKDKWGKTEYLTKDYVNKQFQKVIGFNYKEDPSPQRLVKINFDSLNTKVKTRTDELKAMLDTQLSDLRSLNMLTTIHPVSLSTKNEIGSQIDRLSLVDKEIAEVNSRVNHYEMQSQSARQNIAKEALEKQYERRYFSGRYYQYEIEGKMAGDGFYQVSSDFSKAPDGSTQVKSVYSKTVEQDGMSFIVKISLQPSFGLSRYYRWIEVTPQ